MITAYHRPRSIQEALTLLAQPATYPLGGGTLLAQKHESDIAVVDLQALGLEKIHKIGEKLEIGATATLQSMLESPHTPASLATCIELETSLNLRNMQTVAGSLVAADGRSPFATAMFALDARLTMLSLTGSAKVGLGDYLPLRSEKVPGKLITNIEIPLNVSFAFQSVARTPADRPILCVALTKRPSGRVRLVVGGWGSSPSLALDANDLPGLETAARNATHTAADAWASAEYRSEVSVELVRRCLASFSN
jgi:aerobic carbon-monoxide dehydrogenase medium subunit